MSTTTIFRTNNPVDFTQVDGVYIDERKPPGAIKGIGNDIVAVVGEFERGPVDVITPIGSSQQLFQTFGDLGPDASGAFYKGALSLRNKQFSRLRVIRVSNASQVLATVTLDDGGGSPVNVLQVDANSTGAWGNSLSVAVVAATDGDATHFNLQVLRDGVLAELHRNLDPTVIADSASYGIASDFVALTRLAAGANSGRPVDVAATSLTTGSDGTFADSDYIGSPSDVRGLELLRAIGASNIRWVYAAEKTSLAVNAAILFLTQTTGNKIGIVADPAGTTLASATVSVLRSDRIIYVYQHVDTFIPEANGGRGGLVRVAPTSFAAAALAALPPGRDPAGINSEPFLTGIRAIEFPSLSRDDYITMNEQGIMGLQFTAERQRFGFRSGVTASITPGLETIERRTIADFLQESMGAGLVFFQNIQLSEENKLQVVGAITDFLEKQIRLGLLPSKEDLDFGDDGKLEPFIVDITSLNTAQQEATGLFIVLVRVRIFSSMRFLVLRTEIGEGVEIKVQDATA